MNKVWFIFKSRRASSEHIPCPWPGCPARLKSHGGVTYHANAVHRISNPVKTEELGTRKPTQRPRKDFHLRHFCVLSLYSASTGRPGLEWCWGNTLQGIGTTACGGSRTLNKKLAHWGEKCRAIPRKCQTNVYSVRVEQARVRYDHEARNRVSGEAPPRRDGAALEELVAQKTQFVESCQILVMLARSQEELQNH
ncbi:hypothetical protein B0H14DRAFT_2559587 [Mycena olivaceomarginata]|nr:hypothetical protein B0H14DRAFT_2559587 [Mycena olivaceomarginata]